MDTLVEELVASEMYQFIVVLSASTVISALVDANPIRSLLDGSSGFGSAK